MRDLFARDALQPADEVVGILRKAAVHDKDLAVLGGDDKAVHLGSGHAVQHDDTVLAIGGIHDRISFFVYGKYSFYSINMASPKEKNRYRSATAVR